jgi:hypothetical protein
MLIAVLAIALLVGAVSATVISYFGYIQTTANVIQSVRLNGKAWDDPTVYKPDVYAGDTWCTPDWQTLSNDAGVPVPIKLETTISPVEGVTSWYTFILSVDGTVGDWDRIVTAPAGVSKLSDITSLSFYWMANAASGLPYPVIELDMSDDGIADTWVVWNIGPDKDTSGATPWTQWTGVPNSWHVATIAGGYAGGTGDWAWVLAGYGNGQVLSIKVAIGEGSTNLNSIVYIKDIKVNDNSAIDYGIILPANSASKVEGHVYFLVCAYFPTTTIGKFTITTVVKPA